MLRRSAKFAGFRLSLTQKSILKKALRNISFKYSANIIDSTCGEAPTPFRFRQQKNRYNDTSFMQRLDQHHYKATDMKTRKYQQTWVPSIPLKEIKQRLATEVSKPVEGEEVYSPKSCRDIVDDDTVSRMSMSANRHRLARPQQPMRLKELMNAKKRCIA
uniref:Uncharacterized protein n=1 Tax=Glossina austeni TaxID=7395 RepID=A0A1A9VTE8_GLOAU